MLLSVWKREIGGAMVYIRFDRLFIADEGHNNDNLSKKETI